jgi:hypothetical protein
MIDIFTLVHRGMYGNLWDTARLWEDIRKKGDPLSEDDLQKLLPNYQFLFEDVAGSRCEGKWLMGYTMIASFYDECQGCLEPDMLRKYYHALAHATVSLEVAAAAEQAAVESGLKELIIDAR